MLQHGSILIEHDAEMLAEVLSSKKGKQALLAEVCSTTTSINHHLNKKIDFYGLKTLVGEKFETQLGITLQKGKLTDYQLGSVSTGKDALGEVSIRYEAKGKEVTGRGVSTDVIEASVKAYIDA